MSCYVKFAFQFQVFILFFLLTSLTSPITNLRASPSIRIAPDEINVILTIEEIHEENLNVINDGDEDLQFALEIQYDQRAFQNNYSSYRCSFEQDRPRRDDPGRFALFLEEQPHGFDLAGLFDDYDIDYDLFGGDDFDEIELNEYDVIWVANRQSNEFVEQHNETLERIEEWISNGGVYYCCPLTATWQVPFQLPGGMEPERRSSRQVEVVVEPEENYFVREAGWRAGHQLEGNSYHSGIIPEEAIGDLENSDFQQVILRSTETNESVLVEYTYGIGSCIIHTGNDGHLHRWFQGEGTWAAASGALFDYLNNLTSRNQWLNAEPDEGIIEPDESLELTITFDTGGWIQAIQEADLIFSTNDPDNETLIVPVIMEMVGEGFNFIVNWREDYGYPDEVNFNEAFGELYVGSRYEMQLQASYGGARRANVERIEFEDDMFQIEPDHFSLERDETQELILMLRGSQDGEINSQMTIFTNLEDQQEYPISLSAELTSAPAITVEPLEFEIEIEEDEEVEERLTIGNIGDEVLDFEIMTRDPERGDREAGDLLQTIETEFREFYGLAWDGEYLWAVSCSAALLRMFDPEDGRQMAAYQIVNMPLSMAYNQQEGQFYISASRSRSLYIYDHNGDHVRTAQTPLDDIVGITFDNESRLWLHSWDNFRLSELNDDFEVVREVNYAEYIDEGEGGSIKFVSSHHQGGMWILGNSYLWQFILPEDDDEVELATGFRLEGRGGVRSGFTHDGRDFWAGTYNNIRIERFDDGIDEVEWLRFEPDNGEIEPENNTEITLFIDGSTLSVGAYSADLHINSNDPETPLVIVNIAVEVGDFDPEGWVFWSERYGYPDMVDFSLSQDIYTGWNYVVNLDFVNNTDDEVEVEELASDNRFFTPDTDQMTIPAHETEQVALRYTPEGNGEHEGELRVISNHPARPRFTIPLYGNADLPPTITVSPAELDIHLTQGEEAEYELHLQNGGGYQLEFEIETEIPNNFPSRDDLGDVIHAYRVGNLSNAGGITWDGERIWFYARDNEEMRTLNPDNGEMEREFDVGERAGLGLCWDGQTLALGMRNQIWRFNRNGDLIENIRIPWRTICGLAWDGEAYWVNITDRNMLYRIDQEGEVLREVALEDVHDSELLHLAWDDGPDDGDLWVTSQNGALALLNVEGANAEVAVESELRSQDANRWNDIAHDGSDLLAIAASDWIVRFDDGIGPEPWLSVDPMQGVIEPDDAMVVTISVNTDELEPDEYQVDLILSSNDPQEPEITLPVMITVYEHEGLYSDPPACPFVEEAVLEFPETFINLETTAVQFRLMNLGGDPIEIEEIEFDNGAHFSCDLEPETVIESGHAIAGSVTFAPERSGEFEDRIIMRTNAANPEAGDEGQGDIWYILHGIASSPPQIYLDIEEINVDVIDEHTTTHSFMIYNLSLDGSPLEFNIRSEEVFVEDDGNRAGRSGRSIHRAGSPFRDDIRTLRVAIITDVGRGRNEMYYWADMLDDCNVDYAFFHSSQMRNIDWEDRDVVIVADDQDRDFFDNYAAGFGSLNNWVRDGGLLIGMLCVRQWAECGLPGGLARQRDCHTQWNLLNPDIDLDDGDDEGFPLLKSFEQYRDDGEENFRRNRVNALTSGYFDIDDLPEGAIWYYRADIDGDMITVVEYEYYAGRVLATTMGMYAAWALRQERSGVFFLQNILDWIEHRRRVSWITIDPENGEIEPDQSSEITLIIAGVEQADGTPVVLHIDSNDPMRSRIDVPLMVNVLDEEPVSPWQNPTETDTRQIVYVYDVMINNERGEYGDWIGVFNSDGLCVGHSRCLGEDRTRINVYGDDPETDENDGMQADEDMNFRIWDMSRDACFDAVPELRSGSLQFDPDIVTRVNLTVENDVFQLVITDGWSLISLNIEPNIQYFSSEDAPGADVIRLFDRMTDRVRLLVDECGRFYAPAYHFSNIPYWFCSRGYRIRIDEVSCLRLFGTKIDPQEQIDLQEGWNITAYYPDYMLTILDEDGNDAFQSIADQLIVAKNDEGEFFYPAREFCNMRPLEPGKGYQLKVREECQLIYPEEPERLAPFSIGEPAGLRFFQPKNTGCNMSIFVSALEGIDFHLDDEIGVVNSVGMAVGGAVMTNRPPFGIAVWGNDPTTPDRDGMNEGEPFDFMLRDSRTDEVLELHSNPTGLVYQTDDLIEVTLSTPVAPGEFQIAKVYPNPFNSITNISFNIDRSGVYNLVVYDLMGRRIAGQVMDLKAVGRHYYRFDGRNLSSGTYLIRIKNGNRQVTRKVLFLK